MRTGKYILLLAAALLACACQGVFRPENEFSGPGDIVLTLSSQDNISLETKTDAEDLVDGLKFRNVLVILTNNNNIVVGKEYVEEEEVAGVVTPVTTKTITFNNLSPGNYIAYAYANIDQVQWQKSSESGERISTYFSGISIGDNFSTYLSRELASLTAAGTDVPSSISSGDAMLLTGKLPVEVNLAAVSGVLELHRPVVRFNVIIDNTTDYDVRVDALTFSHFNPDKAYIIEHTDANGLPVLPTGTTYRSMPAFSGPVTVDDGDEETVYSSFVYENSSSNPYKIFATLTLLRNNNPSDYLEMSLGERDFGPINFETLDAMDEGESVDILLFNPQRSYRSGRLYYGISSDNYLAWESAGYDGPDNLFGRAQAIYNQLATDQQSGTPGYTYTGYTFDNTNGYSAWDGVLAHAPKEDAGFDYTGARSKYFSRLSKSGGKFTIHGLAVKSNNDGQVSASSIPNLTIEKGRYTTGNNGNKTKLTDGIESYLIKFKNSSGQNLVSDVNWGSVNKVSKLQFEGASDHQGRQFIIYGKYCSGGLLSRLLSGSNREEDLTYMSRNEDINVTISIFYADQDGTLTFRVDNGDWTTNIITPSHTFN